MEILERFFTTEFDEKIVLLQGAQKITFRELKGYVFAQKIGFEKSDCKNIILTGDDGFNFIVNFFAAILSGKELFLISDKNRIKQLEFEYILPENTCLKKTENHQIDAIIFDYKNIFINFFTSGSTSTPKTIRKTLFNLLEESKDLYDEFGNSIPKNTIFLSTTNFSHMFGMTFELMFPFRNGFVIDTDRIQYPEELDKKNYENYVFVSTPSFLEKLKKYDVDLKTSPRFIITSGAKLNDEAFEYFEKKSQMIEIYGSTETNAIAYKRNSSEKDLKVFPKVQVKIEEAKIIVRSNYFIEDETVLCDDAEATTTGRFMLKERSDRMVKIQEKRVSLPELESILNKSKLVETSHLIKLDDKIAACAVLNVEGKRFFLENGNLSLINQLKFQVNEFSEIIPKKWRFLPDLPLNSCGKIDSLRIKEIFNTNLSYPFVITKEVSASDARLELLFPSNSNYFNGHFRNTPILAGVVQLYYAKDFIKDIFKIDFKPDEVKKIKFSSIIKPDEKICLKLTKKEKSVEYSYNNGEKTFSSGSFVL